MIKQRKIELLAPAKNLECGIEAVNHGADAVYIGAPKFGARAAAVNSLEDIAALVEHAHLYNARIYVTVNTILKEEELKETERMIWELYRIGVDALIVQDMGITRLNLPPIPLHGSTQMDNRTPEKVRFLADAGFRQVVLARELSLQEIRGIHEACPDVPLEVFVHGALCVSYSGQCYVSQACFGRSANRGECAQFCRLPFSLVDADGKTIVRNKHLLSLKDLNQSEVLEELLDAGATSLKIEGRLKDVTYVKNVTAAYRRKLDAIFARRKEYARASSGTCHFDFQPQLGQELQPWFHALLPTRQGRGNHFIRYAQIFGRGDGHFEGTARWIYYGGRRKAFPQRRRCLFSWMSRDICKVSASTGWMVTNSIRQGKCLASNLVHGFIAISTRSLNVSLPVNPPNAKSVFVGSWQILLSGLA